MSINLRWRYYLKPPHVIHMGHDFKNDICSRMKQFNSMVPDGWDSTRLHGHQKTQMVTEVTVGKPDVFLSWLAGMSCSTEIVQFCIMSYNLYCVPLSIIGGLERDPSLSGILDQPVEIALGVITFVYLYFCVCVFVFVYCIVSMRGILDPQLLLPSSQWSSVSWSLSRIPPAGHLRECGAEWITICGNHSIVFPVIGRGKHNWWPGDRRAWPEEGRGDATGMKPSTWQPGRQSLEAIQIRGSVRSGSGLSPEWRQNSSSLYIKFWSWIFNAPGFPAPIAFRKCIALICIWTFKRRKTGITW